MSDISSKRFYYRILTLADVGEKYVRWMNDKDVNKYLESRFSNHTTDAVHSYIKNSLNDSSVHLFGIFNKTTDCHIGNIKLDINHTHKKAEIGLLIGEKQWWGKGVATEAIKAITKYGFTECDIEKIEAGCYQSNKGSLGAFQKVGYKVEGRIRASWILEGKREDGFRLGILKGEFNEQ